MLIHQENDFLNLCNWDSRTTRANAFFPCQIEIHGRLSNLTVGHQAMLEFKYNFGHPWFLRWAPSNGMKKGNKVFSCRIWYPVKLIITMSTFEEKGIFCCFLISRILDWFKLGLVSWNSWQIYSETRGIGTTKTLWSFLWRCFKLCFFQIWTTFMRWMHLPIRLHESKFSLITPETSTPWLIYWVL